VNTSDLPVEIRKVQTFSRIARRICWVGLALVGLGALMAFGGIVFGFRGVKIGLGSFAIEAAQLSTPFLKVWAALVVGVVLGLVLRWLYGLSVLFGNLAAGHIFTSENVRLLRQAGFLMLYLAVSVPVIAIISAGLVRVGIIGAGTFVPQQPNGITPGSFTNLIAPGLVLLASWIMEVGRKTRDEAEEMRRETELMV
jgi:hypothetical protein